MFHGVQGVSCILSQRRTRVPTPDCLLRTTATSAAPFLLLLLLFVPQSTRSFVLGHSTLLSLVQQLGRFNICVLRGSALCEDPVHSASHRFVCGSQQFSRIGYHFQLTVRVARRGRRFKSKKGHVNFVWVNT